VNTPAPTPIYAGTSIPHTALYQTGNGSDGNQCLRCWGWYDDPRHVGQAALLQHGLTLRPWDANPVNKWPRRSGRPKPSVMGPRKPRQEV
jgi:hypothetical protein